MIYNYVVDKHLFYESLYKCAAAYKFFYEHGFIPFYVKIKVFGFIEYRLVQMKLNSLKIKTLRLIVNKDILL